MRFLKNIFRISHKNRYIITEKEIDEQLEKYYKYKNENEEAYTIKVTQNYQFNEIINQVSNQVYANQVVKNDEYNEYGSEEEKWTRLQAS